MSDYLVVIIYWGLVIYGATFLVASSRAFQAFRNIFRKLAFVVFKGSNYATTFVHVINNKVVLENDVRDEEDVKHLGVGYDFISCRMCVGVWVSFPVMYAIGIPYGFAAYAFAYFLATQERT